MAEPVVKTHFRFGNVEATSFAPDCTPGDGVTVGRIEFDTPFPLSRGGSRCPS